MTSPRVLLAGLVLFLAGATIVFVAVGRRNVMLAGAGVAVLWCAVGVLALAAWRGRRRVDWRRIEVEQRLWESGPLGRAWLNVRRRLVR